MFDRIIEAEREVLVMATKQNLPENSAKYEAEKTANLRVRIPAEKKAEWDSWVEQNLKPKGMSVNKWICELLTKETGIDLTFHNAEKRSAEAAQKSN